MSSTLEPRLSAASGNAGTDQRICIPGVGWEGYLAMLRLRGDRPYPRILYFDGDLLLVSSAYAHEFAKKGLGTLVSEIAVGLGIDFQPAGSTTYRRRKQKSGAEPDDSFYFAHGPRIQGKKKITLRSDPPPDLVIEVVHTHHAETVLEIYRRFGVPEVWIWEDNALRILALSADGQYQEVSTSLSLAPLTASDVTSLVNRSENQPYRLWILELRQWVQGVLLPRRNPQQPR